MKNTIYKIEPFEVLTYTIRLLSIPILFLLIYNYQINPFAFSIIMIIPISILLFSRTSRLIITKCFVLFEHRNIIRFMSSKKKIFIAEIEKIEYENEKNQLARQILPKGYMTTSSPAKLKLHLVNKDIISQVQIGTNKQFVKAIKILNGLIENKKR